MSKGKGGGERPKRSTVERITELAQPLADELGLFLWDVRFEKEGATWYLRVLIDKDGGVTMEDCENFTRPFNKILDEEDPIAQSYVFECGSPGLGRELRKPIHFEVCIGDAVRVRLIRPDENGEREFIVGLVGYDDTNKVIACQTLDENGDGVENVRFKLSDCAFVKLFDDGDLESELAGAKFD
ncbi:ribosome maturation factor RimP [uncultured Ruminococcus sp.]|uniref:ribosome maturation factor RimP n=1 Tax=uncultured Ruminococcus sp. TaxID=165186 RepID=UPI000ED0E2F0|nr:ribosome maturation factor RimP [uncultured Ruminococcus sp.]HCJ41570.1 ribosome assembly cofactor RimP [Ruminococcus sp.]